jgi:prophage antirepressor-like protein
MLTFFYKNREVRTVGTNEVPEWVAMDLAGPLNVTQQAVSKRLAAMPAEWKGTTLSCTLGGQQQMLTVKEPGLYELIFRSDKPEAREFQRWVFEEVLPTIRKTGSFQVATQPKALPVQPPAMQAVGSLMFMGRDILGAAQLITAMLRAEEHVQPKGMQLSLLKILNDHLEFIGFHHAKALEASRKAADPDYDVMKDLDPDGRSYSFLEWMAQKVK